MTCSLDAPRRARCIRWKPKSSSRSRSFRHITRLPLLKERSMSGTLGLPSAIWKTSISQRSLRFQERDLPQSPSFRVFIAKCSIWKDRIAKSRDSSNRAASNSTERKFATQRPSLPLNRVRLSASIESTQYEYGEALRHVAGRKYRFAVFEGVRFIRR